MMNVFGLGEPHANPTAIRFQNDFRNPVDTGAMVLPNTFKVIANSDEGVDYDPYTSPSMEDALPGMAGETFIDMVSNFEPTGESFDKLDWYTFEKEIIWTAGQSGLDHIFQKLTAYDGPNVWAKSNPNDGEGILMSGETRPLYPVVFPDSGGYSAPFTSHIGNYWQLSFGKTFYYLLDKSVSPPTYGYIRSGGWTLATTPIQFYASFRWNEETDDVIDYFGGTFSLFYRPVGEERIGTGPVEFELYGIVLNQPNWKVGNIPDLDIETTHITTPYDEESLQDYLSAPGIPSTVTVEPYFA